MNSDAMMLGLIAIADIALLVYLRRRRIRRVRRQQITDQMTASLRLAIRRANEMSSKPSRYREGATSPRYAASLPQA